MTPRFLNLRDGGNLPRQRPGMIRTVMMVPVAVMLCYVAACVILSI